MHALADDTSPTESLGLIAACACHCAPANILQINAKISKTTHLKEMNFEIEKLKQMLIATREKNGGQQTGQDGVEG